MVKISKNANLIEQKVSTLFMRVIKKKEWKQREGEWAFKKERERELSSVSLFIARLAIEVIGNVVKQEKTL